MATPLTNLNTKVQLLLQLTAQKAIDLATPQNSITKNETLQTTFGTGAAKADLEFSDSRTLIASANETLDLVGSLSGAFGDTLSFAKIKGLFVKNTSDEAAIKIEGGANPPDNMIDVPSLPAGGVAMLAVADADGLFGALAAGSKDEIKITNLDGVNAATYEIILWGESA